VRALRYTPSYTVPASVVAGILLGGPWTWLTPAYVFLLLPIVELLAGRNPMNLDPGSERKAKEERLYSWILWSYIPIQLALTFYAIGAVVSGNFSLAESAGIILSLGISNGGVGITVAHELIHRSARFEQILGRILLMSTWYMHFAIEHVRGHHVHVATPDDPATAPMGTSFYRYWVRTIPEQWFSAWQLEAKRLKKRKLPVKSLNNEMIRFVIIQILLTLTMALVFGFAGMLAFLLSCVVAFSLLEAVNYLEHYGLERAVDESGKPEKVNPGHSWNSDHEVSRMFLFELSRHSDHHATASRKYQVLRSFEESPQLPTGYPGMILLALIPPVWFSVMDPLARKHTGTRG
jgi:alkane 1-monooxygenase